MSIQNHFPLQIEAFHAAILDDCQRAARPLQSDSMVLRLRANALALAKVQLAMAALLRGEPTEPTANDHLEEAPAVDPAASDDFASPQWPDEIPGACAPFDAVSPDQPASDFIEASLARPTTPRNAQEDRVVTGDVLSRFVSHRLKPKESPHEVWQSLQEVHPGKQRHNPALPRAGFRSASR